MTVMEEWIDRRGRFIRTDTTNQSPLGAQPCLNLGGDSFVELGMVQ